MGYDITFHPISEEQMDAWYFPCWTAWQRGYVPSGGGGGRRGDGSVYINKYRDLMKYAAGTLPSERFETTHGFYMAVVQGFSASIIMCGGLPFLSWRRSTR